MNQFLRKLLNLDTLGLAVRVASQQALLIDDLNREIAHIRLEHTRAIRDLVEQFFFAQEAGIDVRDQLQAGLRDLQDEVARQEEHAPSA